MSRSAAAGTTGELRWLTPDWPAPAGVRAACSTRAGGVSPAPYDSLNLGDHVGDAEACVAENRQRFQQGLQARPVFLRQVHGWGVVQLDARTPDATEADACWTTEPGLACTIMVADCLPVLLADADGKVVGAAHCGWRGLAGRQGAGVLEALWAQLAPRIARDPIEAAARTLAWLGPCIGPQAFEVGSEVRAAFVAGDPAAAAAFSPASRQLPGNLHSHGAGPPPADLHSSGAGPALADLHSPGAAPPPAGDKFLADLPLLARRRLQALGITAISGNDGTGSWCTVANPSRFFSHRRDRVSGRFAAAVWRA